MQPAYYSVKVRQVGDNIVATADLRIARDVWITVKSSVSQNAIKNLFTKTFEGQIPAGETMGGFFGKLWGGVKKIAKKVAKSKVIKGAFKVIKKVAKNPLFQGAITAIPGVGPIIGPTLAIATTAYAGVKAATAKRAGKKKKARAYARQAIKISRSKRLPKAQMQRAFKFGMGQGISPEMWQMMIYGARMFGRRVKPFGTPGMPMPYPNLRSV